MPELNRIQFIQLVLLMSAVPIQYWLTNGSSENVRQIELKRVLTSISHLNSYLLDIKGWMRWCVEFWSDTPTSEMIPDSNSNDGTGHFTSSTEPRSPRPTHIMYRVGDVFRHKVHGYRGVVIGWDERARAPVDWLDVTHRNRPVNYRFVSSFSFYQDWRQLPNYAVLIDTRDRLTPQLAYIVEENLEIVNNGGRIFHPLVDHYFERFDGKRYQMRPWLKRVYPHDGPN